MNLDTLTLEYLLKNGIACQKRTGRHKQFTIYIEDSKYPKGLVIKGPYHTDLVTKIKDRYAKVKKEGFLFIIQPIEYITLKEGHFIIYPNVGIEPMKECVTEMNEESFSDYKYRVLQRTKLKKVSDILRDKPESVWILDWATHITQVYIYLFLLGCGDQGFYNCLANEETKEIFIIDFDENRTPSSKIREDKFFYFSRVPARDVAEVYEKYVAWNFLVEWIDTVKEGENLDQVKEYMKSRGVPIKKMENHGLMGGSITYSGYKLDVMKSGLQKYIRRNEPVKALECAFELYRMTEVDLRPAASNMYNRLAVIAVEDIGPSNVSLVLTVIQNVLDDKRDSALLCSMVQALAGSKKTRVLSHLNRAYFPSNKEIREKHNINIATLGKSEWKPLPGDPDIEFLDQFVGNFDKCLQSKYFDAFYWCHLIRQKLTVSDKYIKGARRYNRGGSDMIIWSILEPYVPKHIFTTLLKAYNTFSEKNVFLHLAIFVAIKSIDVQPTKLEDNVEKWKKIPFLPALFLGRYKLDIDPWVVDKHTSEGRKAGMGRDEFVTEGSKVEPEDPAFLTEEYRAFAEIYKM